MYITNKCINRFLHDYQKKRKKKKETFTRVRKTLVTKKKQRVFVLLNIKVNNLPKNNALMCPFRSKGNIKTISGFFFLTVVFNINFVIGPN